MINTFEIGETLNMIKNEHLDVRTITMGISLLDCIDSDYKKACDKIYDKITYLAKDLVKVGEDLQAEFGVPIIHKRISVTPASLLCAACGHPVEIAKALDRAANTVGVNFLGGYSALVQKGCTKSELEFINSIPEALACTEVVCSSVAVASTKTGINMDAVKQIGHIIKQTAELTKDKDGLGCAKFVVFANPVEDNPFMAGAFHGVSEPECAINVGVSGPGVVKCVIDKLDGADFAKVSEAIKKTAFKITRVGQLVALEASKRLNAEFGIVDLSLAPTPAVGDSVARILEAMGLEQCGT
ncbi:MAG: DUF711 family protein, partial [Bacillota bacterium]|nr:DUF711 family protein [Bacillota bacterium]